MRFRHKQYQHVLYKTDSKKLQFIDWKAETEDKELIESLKKNPHVEVIEEKAPKKKRG